MRLIRLEHIKKDYKTPDGVVVASALRGITFSVEEGEFVAIMGPSGCGKSTLLHILGFLDEPTEGSYLFKDSNSETINGDRVAEIRNREIGFVFQSFNLLPRMTVRENVKLPLLYSDIPEDKWEERVEKAIHTVGLPHRQDFYPTKLSGGEKQRVAIARALVGNPRLILADEPTGNLDSRSGEMIMETLEYLHDSLGHTIILITHETYTAEHAGRIIKLKDGLVESDTKVTNRHRAEDFIK